MLIGLLTTSCKFFDHGEGSAMKKARAQENAFFTDLNGFTADGLAVTRDIENIEGYDSRKLELTCDIYVGLNKKEIDLESDRSTGYQGSVDSDFYNLESDVTEMIGVEFELDSEDKTFEYKVATQLENLQYANIGSEDSPQWMPMADIFIEIEEAVNGEMTEVTKTFDARTGKVEFQTEDNENTELISCSLKLVDKE